MRNSHFFLSGRVLSERVPQAMNHAAFVIFAEFAEFADFADFCLDFAGQNFCALCGDFVIVSEIRRVQRNLPPILRNLRRNMLSDQVLSEQVAPHVEYIHN